MQVKGTEGRGIRRQRGRGAVGEGRGFGLLRATRPRFSSPPARARALSSPGRPPTAVFPSCLPPTHPHPPTPSSLFPLLSPPLCSSPPSPPLPSRPSPLPSRARCTSLSLLAISRAVVFPSADPPRNPPPPSPRSPSLASPWLVTAEPSPGSGVPTTSFLASFRTDADLSPTLQRQHPVGPDLLPAHPPRACLFRLPCRAAARRACPLPPCPTPFADRSSLCLQSNRQSWSGGVAPYYLTINQGGSTSNVVRPRFAHLDRGSRSGR